MNHIKKEILYQDWSMPLDGDCDSQNILVELNEFKDSIEKITAIQTELIKLNVKEFINFIINTFLNKTPNPNRLSFLLFDEYSIIEDTDVELAIDIPYISNCNISHYSGDEDYYLIEEITFNFSVNQNLTSLKSTVKKAIRHLSFESKGNSFNLTKGLIKQITIDKTFLKIIIEPTRSFQVENTF